MGGFHSLLGAYSNMRLISHYVVYEPHSLSKFKGLLDLDSIMLICQPSWGSTGMYDTLGVELKLSC